MGGLPFGAPTTFHPERLRSHLPSSASQALRPMKHGDASCRPRSSTEWPIREDADFVHHTPTFNYLHVKKMIHYAQDFLATAVHPGSGGWMQLSQGLGLKINIESMRIRKPGATQITFYKLNRRLSGGILGND